MTTREVVLDGGSPWGFRLHGGADLNQPLRISRVNPGSKAALRGIREGDFITSINNQSTKDISNAEAHALLRNSGDTLKLGLNE
jgi:C-terminal processing protease CtpA/Prc